MKAKKIRQTSCDSCNNFVYDEDYECYTCEMNLDEDEMAKFCHQHLIIVLTINRGMNI